MWTGADARHLLVRATFGATDEQVSEYAALSCGDAVDRLLDEACHAPQPSAPAWVRDPWVNTERRYVDTTPEEFRRMHGETNGRYFRETADLRRWWFEELLNSPVPLREVMTLFWHGHFASSIGKVLVSQAMYQQNAAQRRHAVGNFRSLLRAMTIDPAMLIYLDLEDSDRKQPNENYARELFELFALGHGQYTQEDIMETARALSGWGLDAPPGTTLPARETDPTANRRFTRDGLVPRLVPERHDAGDKTLFGQTGPWGLEDVIRLTVAQPACGDFLARKLQAFFGLADPQRRVAFEMAEAFRESDGEIAPMLRVLFTAPEFYAPASRGRLIKSPVALVVGACRQLQIEARFTRGLNRYLAALGQELFNPPNVKGWPGGDVWISTGTMALRYHLADVVLDSREPPGMEPMGRGPGRPLLLPRDPKERELLLQRLSEGGREMGMDGEGGPRGRGSDEPPISLRFDPARLADGALTESPAALVEFLGHRLLAEGLRPELRSVAADAAERAAPEARVTAVVRTLISSPDYQLY
jgi:uncharacterized protein (DUF1800 family)